MVFFFFKQKTAYEMRISDWSSDVCSSDLNHSLDPPCNSFGAYASNPFDRRTYVRLSRSTARSVFDESRIVHITWPNGDGLAFQLLLDGDRKSTRLNSSH